MIRYLFILFCLLIALPVNADWQSTLEANFDHAETFDDLADWKRTTTGDVYTGDMPVHSADSSDTPWDYYSLWETIDTGINWIGDHGSDYNWHGSTKSLRMYYGGSDTGGGPSRMAYYIGGGNPDAGYSDVYVFYMVKYVTGFFPMTGDVFNTFAAFKSFEIETGFRDVWNWGTVEQQALTDGTDQVDHAYGLNFSVWNMTYWNYSPNEYGSDLNYLVFPYYPGSASCSYHYTTEHYDGSPFRDTSPGDILRTGEVWMGVELHYSLSNPHGSANGTMEVWIYDSGGNVTSHQASTTEITFDDLNASGCEYTLSHKINKFVIGGNKLGFASCPGTLYVDDFIVDSGRIGPTYFGLLSGSTTCYPDVDGDLYPGSGSEVVETCSTDYYEPSHFTAMTTDCNDSNASINPGAIDSSCDGVDQDCSGADNCPSGHAFGATFMGARLIN